jgi:hypothetical protein
VVRLRDIEEYSGVQTAAHLGLTCPPSRRVCIARKALRVRFDAELSAPRGVAP